MVDTSKLERYIQGPTPERPLDRSIQGPVPERPIIDARRIQQLIGLLGRAADLEKLVHANFSDNDHPQYILHSLADVVSDFLVASGNDVYVKKTLAETGAILEGDIDHDNLVGFVAGEHIAEGTIDHGSIAGLTDNDHPQYAGVLENQVFG